MIEGDRPMSAPAVGRFVAFGEIMLRLSPPGRELMLQTPRLDVWVAGAEANVAVALAQLGHAATLVSALPDTPIGEGALTTLRGYGVDCSAIRRAPGRMGLYFVESGAGLRATEIFYDRAYSTFADQDPASWDWNKPLTGADRLHLSGITPALGPAGTEAALTAAAAATRLGIPISFDGNYRSRLWEAWDGRPRETLHRLVEQADMLFGNHRDIALLLDRPFSNAGPTRRREAAEAAFAAYPKLRLIASTARALDTVDHHRISARVDTPEAAYETEEMAIPAIVDRIGTGDAFAAGVLHAHRLGLAPDEMARYGLALAALKHSIPGDATIVSRHRLEQFLTGSLDARR
jgi:2-dehydro-3-deoxygluconokinase